MNIKGIFFCAVWLVLADLSLVASQNLFPVTSILCNVFPLSAVDQFHTDGGLCVCLFIPTPWPVHSAALNLPIGANVGN